MGEINMIKNSLTVLLLLTSVLSLATKAMAKDIDWSLLQLEDKVRIQNFIDAKQSATDAPTLAELGILYYDLAIQDTPSANSKAQVYFEQYLQAQSQPDSMILALLGSTKTMRARESESIGDKVKWVNQGIADLNEAVMLAPSNVQVRLLRIRVFSQLPDMFKKKVVVLKDIAYLLDHSLINDEATRNRLIKLRNSLQ